MKNRKGLKYLYIKKKKKGFLPGLDVNGDGILEFQLLFGVTIKKLFDICFVFFFPHKENKR